MGSEIIWNAPTKGVFMVFLKFESAMAVTELRAAELLTDRDSRDTPGRSFQAAASMSSVWCLLSVTGLCSCISIIILHCVYQSSGNSRGGGLVLPFCHIQLSL